MSDIDHQVDDVGGIQNEAMDAAFDHYIERINRGERISRREIEERYPEFAGPLLERLEVFELVDPDPGATAELRTIADYTLLRQIGRGGMGTVYEAEQESMHRRVALKVLHPAIAADTTMVARFAREARIAGSLHHPNIVPVFAMGIAEHTPYYAMEFVEGETLADHLARSRKSSGTVEDSLPFGTQRDVRFFANVAEGFASIADALDYAHSRGVIHRDVKPSNIIVDSREEAWAGASLFLPEGRTGMLRLLDFGLARLEGHASLTIDGDLVGTPSYMSPEQSRRDEKKVDHRSDLYSLGATLYEVLTGHAAFRGQSYQDTISRLQESEPTAPREHQPQIPEGLEAIVLKCLRKDPGERYRTAEALAQDLRRFVRGVPVEARPPSRWERFSRTLWRRRRRIVFAAVLASVGLIGLATTTVFVARERRAAVLERDAARQSLYIANIHVLQDTWRVGNTRRLLAGLAEQVPQSGELDLRSWEWFFLRGLVEKHALDFRGHNGTVNALAWSPDGALVASGGSGAIVRIWHSSTGQEVLQIPANRRVLSIDWSPDTEVLAVSHAEGADFWSPRTGQLLTSLTADVHRKTTKILWSPDGRRVAFIEEKQLAVFERDALFAPRGEDKLPAAPLRVELGQPVAAWCPKRPWIGIVTPRRRLAVVDGRTGRQLRQSEPLREVCHAIAWSSDGTRLAAAGSQQLARIWAVKESDALVVTGSHGGRVLTMDWSATYGLACGGVDGVLRVWDTDKLVTGSTLRGHEQAITCARWSPDGAVLASASTDGRVKLWESERDPASVLLSGHRQCFSWSPDGQYLAARGHPGRGQTQAAVTLYDARTLQVIRSLGLFIPSDRSNTSCHQLAFSPDSRSLAITRRDGKVKVWSIPQGRLLATLQTHKEAAWPLSWNGSGSRLATGGNDGKIRLWDTETFEKVGEFDQGSPLCGLDWSTDGGAIAAMGTDQVLQVWDPSTAQIRFRKRLHKEPYGQLLGRFVVSFHPNGRQVAAASASGDVLIFNSHTGVEELRLEGHGSSVRSIRWNPDGSRIATGSEDRTIILWHSKTGAELLALSGGMLAVRSVDWSPDGMQLGAICEPDGLRIWDASIGYGIGPPVARD